MNAKIKKLSLFLHKLGLQKEAEETSVFLDPSEEDLPKKFPLAFRRWLRESYFAHDIDSRYDIGRRSRIANWLFGKGDYREKLRIYSLWQAEQASRYDKRDEPLYNAPEAGEPEDISEPAQLDLFARLTPVSEKTLKGKLK